MVSSCVGVRLRFFPLQSYEKLLLEIARSGNDYRGAYNGNRRFTGVFRLRSFYMISAESVDGLFCHTIF